MSVYRQGDILLGRIDFVPISLEKKKGVVIATGAVTGHQHKIKDRKSARLYTPGHDRTFALPVDFYLEVIKDQAELVHPEHKTIVLERGWYRVWRQREYQEQGFDNVAD